MRRFFGYISTRQEMPPQQHHKRHPRQHDRDPHQGIVKKREGF